MYRIELAGRIIGYTEFETGDPPMGVASGLIHFCDIERPFELFRRYCESAGITINELDEKWEFIDTQVIPELKVFRGDGKEIHGEAGACITGMREEGYQISVLGIPYSFYGEEFARLRKAYDDQFKP
jgi:hypothetical protein